jgi:nitrate reductase NapE component
MGRRVVEATNACRIRRTRGERVRLLRFLVLTVRLLPLIAGAFFARAF